MPSIRKLVIAVLALGLSACASSHLVQVPPKVDLANLGTVGLIDIASPKDASLGEQANRQFLTTIQTAQPGVPVLELGERSRVLEDVGGATLDPATVRALGAKHGVDVLLWGVLDTQEVRPKVSLSGLQSLSAKAEIEGTFLAKLLDTRTGATLWTFSSTDKRTVAALSVSGKGVSGSGASEPQEVRGELAQSLVDQAVSDFQPTWKRVRDD